jgi:hypothetical protein
MSAETAAHQLDSMYGCVFISLFVQGQSITSAGAVYYMPHRRVQLQLFMASHMYLRYSLWNLSHASSV